MKLAKLHKVYCPLCNSEHNLMVSGESDYIFCAYCGQKIFLDEDIVPTKKKINNNNNNNNVNFNNFTPNRYTYAPEAIKANNNYNEKKKSNKFKTVIIIVVMLFIAFCIYTVLAPKNIRSDFKAAMDSYEEVIDGYVEITKKYKANPKDKSIVKDYFEYLETYKQAVKDFENWESNDLTDDELEYYLEVQERVSKKLLEAAF